MSVATAGHDGLLDAPTVHLTASLGGHLELLVSLGSRLEGYATVWVTAAGTGADPLRAAGEEVRELPRFSRSRPLSAVQNVLRSFGMVTRERPRVVVTTGAGSVVAFCVFARLFGARVIFVETMARVTSASASGRILSRVASRVVIQWPEMAEVYPGATVCRPVLLELASTGRAAPAGNGAQAGTGTGTRGGTLVAVGTHRHAFDRLLALVDRAIEARALPIPVTAQSGASAYRPEHYEAEPWIPHERLGRAIARSECVICHGGAAIIADALRSGHTPLVLARQASLGEHVDDHQAQLVEKLAALGMIVPLDGEIREADVALARAGGHGRRSPLDGVPVNEILAEELPLIPSREGLAD